MSVDDLDWVSSAEQVFTVTHGQRGNFADSLAAGLQLLVEPRVGKPVAYGILMLVLDEAHLLNISASAPGPASRRR